MNQKDPNPTHAASLTRTPLFAFVELEDPTPPLCPLSSALSSPIPDQEPVNVTDAGGEGQRRGREGRMRACRQIHRWCDVLNSVHFLKILIFSLGKEWLYND